LFNADDDDAREMNSIFNVGYHKGKTSPNQVVSAYLLLPNQGMFRLLPPLFVYSLIIWSYVVFLLSTLTLPSQLQVAILIPFHVLVILVIWSFTLTCLIDPGTVSTVTTLEGGNDMPLMERGRDSFDSLHSNDTTLPTLTQLDGSEEKTKINRSTSLSNTSPIFCQKCKVVKPPRAHHCSTCGKCILRMDHHCPWFANCIGLHNYRFFILFLVYTFLYTLFIAIGLYFYQAGQFNGDEQLNIFIIWIMSLVFCIVLFLFLSTHIYLMSRNQTTIESLDGSTNYDEGMVANFKSVFPRWYSLLPM
jgi:palmitoyltransferase